MRRLRRVRVDAPRVWSESLVMSQPARPRGVLMALVRLSLLASIVGALGACLPAHLRATDPPDSPPPAAATSMPGGEASPAEDPSRVEEEFSLHASDGASEQALQAYAVTKPEIRDRA